MLWTTQITTIIATSNCTRRLMSVWSISCFKQNHFLDVNMLAGITKLHLLQVVAIMKNEMRELVLPYIIEDYRRIMGKINDEDAPILVRDSRYSAFQTPLGGLADFTPENFKVLGVPFWSSNWKFNEIPPPRNCSAGRFAGE